MIKKVILLAIMLSVTNIHAVMLMNIVNGYSDILLVCCAQKIDGEKKVWDPSKWIRIEPNRSRAISLDLPRGTKIRMMYAENREYVLENLDDCHFTCKELVHTYESIEFLDNSLAESRRYQIFCDPRGFHPTLYVDEEGKIYFI